MPPDTTSYMIAGYVVIFLGMALYVLSLWLRHRRIAAEIAYLQEMEKAEGRR